MPAEELEHRTLHGRITEPFAQFIRREPGKRKEPFGARCIAQHPAECLQRGSGRIDAEIWGGGRCAGDCQGLPG